MSHEPPKSAIDEFKGKQGLTRLINALGYSKDGLAAAWKNEAAFREEVLLAAVAFPLAFYLGQTGIERALLAARGTPTYERTLRLQRTVLVDEAAACYIRLRYRPPEGDDPRRPIARLRALTRTALFRRPR